VAAPVDSQAKRPLGKIDAAPQSDCRYVSHAMRSSSRTCVQAARGA